MLCGGEKACRSHYQELRYSPTLLAGQMVNVHRVSQALNDRPSQYLGHLTSMQQSYSLSSSISSQLSRSLTKKYLCQGGRLQWGWRWLHANTGQR